MVEESGSVLVDADPRRLGSLGEVGPLAFGTWRFTHAGRDEARAALVAAIDAGMRLVDTADVYGLDFGGRGFGSAEELLGEVLTADPGLRDSVVLATKGGIVPGVPYDSSPAYLRTACEASLRRLQVDVIDLYQVHRPDLFAHPADVAETLASLREQGLVREVGISNHTPSQHEALASALAFPLVSVQPELSVVQLAPLRDGTLDLCCRDGVVPLAWSPLGKGRVPTGEGLRPELVEVLDDLAAREGVDRAAVALAFVLCHPSRPVAIIGSQDPARIRATTAALGVHLTRGDVYRIVEASDGVPLP
jgi:aryl-alcohol dehydrogenase-like predicted oxidoreductase